MRNLWGFGIAVRWISGGILDTSAPLPVLTIQKLIQLQNTFTTFLEYQKHFYFLEIHFFELPKTSKKSHWKISKISLDFESHSICLTFDFFSQAQMLRKIENQIWAALFGRWLWGRSWSFLPRRTNGNTGAERWEHTKISKYSLIIIWFHVTCSKWILGGGFWWTAGAKIKDPSEIMRLRVGELECRKIMLAIRILEL